MVITIDTWCSVFNEVELPAMLPFSFPGKVRMGLSGSFLSPGRRLERTSSDTGNNAEINQVKGQGLGHCIATYLVSIHKR